MVAAIGLIMTGGAAGASPASPQPTVSQVKAKLNKLTAQENWLVQRYDQASQDLSSAKQRLTLVDQEVTRDQAQFHAMQGAIAQIASVAYENGNMTSAAAMLTSGNPQTLLAQSAILTHLSTDNQQQLEEFIQMARELEQSRQTAERTETAVSSLKTHLSDQRTTLEKLINKQRGMLASLTAQQQTGLIGSGGSIGGTDTVPTNSQAGKAVAFAFAQLGCPYVFGGVGPCADGFDCSGLMMQAWAAAGVSIPRTSYEQADLPAVSTSDLQPGDILEFAGDSHVGMYVGNGMLIDAPQPGEDVEEVPLAGWYTENLDGAFVP
jgi:peptidoglycan DL-endopeptidase CwlO